ncbi:MAG: FGGY-family carbohydrate kinase [Cryobacterium sp.]|nr:FGGY-family carbohydrate kinase [Cryobacterium sp.]
MTQSLLFVGVDLGTSSVKVTALSEKGRVVAKTSAGYPTQRPEIGAALQDPELWVKATIDALRELNDKTRGSRWAGIALAGMLPTLVILNSKLEPVGSAVTWEDSRAETQAQAFLSKHGADLYQVTGQRVDARYLIPMFERQKSQNRYVADVAAFVVGAKDYLFHALTKTLLTDPSTATGFGCYDIKANSWTQAVSLLPGVPELAPSETIRPLEQTIARQIGIEPGLPIVLGAADSVLGALGLNVSRRGDIAYISGTSTVVLGVEDKYVPDSKQRYLVTPMAVGGFGVEMDLLATGSAIKWIGGLFGFADQRQVVQAAFDTPIYTAPTFLPYLAPGEQGALWNPNLQGTLLNLSIANTRNEIARGLLNGILIESARCLRVLSELFHSLAPTVHVSGWSAQSGEFKQALADISGFAVVSDTTRESEHTSIGAAILAGRVVGDSAFEFVSRSEVVAPNPGAAADWAEAFDRYEQARENIFGVS